MSQRIRESLATAEEIVGQARAIEHQAQLIASRLRPLSDEPARPSGAPACAGPKLADVLHESLAALKVQGEVLAAAGALLVVARPSEAGCSGDRL